MPSPRQVPIDHLEEAQASLKYAESDDAANAAFGVEHTQDFYT
jgi:hypothetical protein